MHTNYSNTYVNIVTLISTRHTLMTDKHDDTDERDNGLVGQTPPRANNANIH